MNPEYTKATHLIIDFFGCQNMIATEEQIRSIIATTGCNFVNKIDNETAIYQLEEGYMTLIVNETYRYIAIDFYAQKSNDDLKLALPLLSRLFKPKQEQTRVLRRGMIS